MRFRREEGAGDGIINLESLLDVMFILLIFFMATTTFKEEEHDKPIKLTGAPKNRSALSSQKKTIVVNIRERSKNKDDPLFVVESKRVNLFELQKMVKDGVQRDKNMSVLIRGDKLALHGDVAKAIAACHAGGVGEAKIAYIDQPNE